MNKHAPHSLSKPPPHYKANDQKIINSKTNFWSNIHDRFGPFHYDMPINSSNTLFMEINQALLEQHLQT